MTRNLAADPETHPAGQYQPEPTQQASQDAFCRDQVLLMLERFPELPPRAPEDFARDDTTLLALTNDEDLVFGLEPDMAILSRSSFPYRTFDRIVAVEDGHPALIRHQCKLGVNAPSPSPGPWA